MIVDARDEAKLPILLNSLSHDALNIFDGLPEPKNTLCDVIADFSAYFGENQASCYDAKHSCGQISK